MLTLETKIIRGSIFIENSKSVVKKDLKSLPRKKFQAHAVVQVKSQFFKEKIIQMLKCERLLNSF